MNTSNRQRPRSVRLPEKLRKLRESLGFSQNEMLRAIGFESRYDRTSISHFESGEREPPLPVLLAYARIGKTTMEILVDDALEF